MAKIEIFKIQEAATAILKIAFLAITRQPIVRFQRNFLQGVGRHVDKGYITKTANY